ETLAAVRRVDGAPRRAWQDPVLDACLVEHVQLLLGVDDLMGVVDRVDARALHLRTDPLEAVVEAVTEGRLDPEAVEPPTCRVRHPGMSTRRPRGSTFSF